MRVVIAEDSVLLREGLTRLLTEAGHEVAAVAGDAEGFLRAVAEHTPDVVVVDVRMPPTFTDEGLRAALVVRDRWPKVGVLVLSQWVEERYATELISGRPHGVGYLLKDRVADVTEFLDALARVADGGSALDPEVVAQLLARSRHPLGELTPREREVLALMAEGRSNAAIADALVVGGGAVEKHINNIFTKLGLAPGDRDHRRVLAVLRYLGPDERGITMTFMSTTGQAPFPRRTPGPAGPAAHDARPLGGPRGRRAGGPGPDRLDRLQPGGHDRPGELSVQLPVPVQDRQVAVNINAGDVTLREAPGSARAADRNRPVRPHPPGHQREHHADRRQYRHELQRDQYRLRDERHPRRPGADRGHPVEQRRRHHGVRLLQRHDAVGLRRQR